MRHDMKPQGVTHSQTALC